MSNHTEPKAGATNGGGDTTAGYDLIVAASWLPVHTNPLRWRDGAGNAARVLRSALAERSGAWIGVTTNRPSEAVLLDDVWLHPVALDPPTAEAYLHGHCYSTLSPLYHDSGRMPVFEPLWRSAYQKVNRRMARSIAAAAAPGATVWVHDYHLQLVPGYLRALRPDTRIGFFLHSPFPTVQRFAAQPLREDIIASLCAADLVGFQHARSAANFNDLLDTLGTPRDVSPPAVEVFPTSADMTAIDQVTRRPDVRRAAADIRTNLGDPRTVLLSIGAADHAESSHRLLDAYAQLLAEGRVQPEHTVLVHVAVCGDDATHLHCDRERLDRAIAQINGVHGRLGRLAIHYVHREQTLPDVVALYLAADVMLALPLDDGMSLAAKEYVAARADNTGRLVLSEFSGAAIDFPQADLVNPYDIDAVKDAIVLATDSLDADSVAAMRRHLTCHDSAAWAHRFLSTLSAITPRDALGASR